MNWLRRIRRWFRDPLGPCPECGAPLREIPWTGYLVCTVCEYGDWVKKGSDG